MLGATAESSTLKKAAFPTLFAWAQLWLCRRQWWAEACVVLTLHPLLPPPCPPSKLACTRGQQSAGPAWCFCQPGQCWFRHCCGVSCVQWIDSVLPAGDVDVAGVGRSPGRGPREVCLLWGLGHFSQVGGPFLLLRREYHFFPRHCVGSIIVVW